MNNVLKALVIGWLVATGALVATGVQTARLWEHQKHEAQLQKMIQDVEQIQAEQKAINSSYIKAWENQQQTADLLITWGTYVKERTEMATSNLRGSVAYKR